MRNKRLLKLLLLLTLCAVIFLVVSTFFYKGIKPISIRKVSPCIILQDNSFVYVEKLETETKQYICAEVITDAPNAKLTLSVYSIDNSLLATYEETQLITTPDSSYVVFFIEPDIPTGIYTGRLYWLRPILADFNFEVKEVSK